ncbi:uncharacterized protein LOC119769093 [Culex quinquefasciatus]|uniref:uncharacterized protein LOC119769093 n=1 Tax=Culex quinquefasciatus TaxID=7176 RepID=UPI0018E39D0D|nr:uncharacterized protein LOC119769093 [Culex quinquefasciatus]
MVFGTTLKIPSEFFVRNGKIATITDFANSLRKAMQNMRPTETAWHDQRKVFVHPDLSTCEQVFVRNDAIRPSLSPPYSGPHRVISRSEKHYKVIVNGRTVNISIDRLKPAYTTDAPTQQDSSTTNSTSASTMTTRSGRRVVIPLRLGQPVQPSPSARTGPKVSTGVALRVRSVNTPPHCARYTRSKRSRSTSDPGQIPDGNCAQTSELEQSG